MDEIEDRYLVYIGTYASEENQGIYIYNLDITSGKLEKIAGVKGIENPSYLAIDKQLRYLYAVSETESFQGKNGGSVSAFIIDAKTGELKFLNSKPTKGKAPCYLCMDNSNEHIFVANYTEGTFTGYPINLDGSIGDISNIITHEGFGPNKERQEKPHVHYVAFTPEEKYLCSVDLGLDSVDFYSLNKEKSTLSEAMSIKVKPGSGPRHIEFSPNGKYAYVINELSSDIVVVKYPSLQIVQTISTLPEEFVGENISAAIHMSTNGDFLYASNRGHNSIAVFRIDRGSGMLELVANCNTKGKNPRDFATDPTGHYLIVANQDSDTITTFEINQQTGELKCIGESVNIKAPVCIKIIKIKA